MQDDNPNHQYDFSSFELELITKMGQKPEGYATAKAVYYAVGGACIFQSIRFFVNFGERLTLLQKLKSCNLFSCLEPTNNHTI